LHRDVYTFIIKSRRILLIMRTFQIKLETQSKRTFFFQFPTPNRVFYENIVVIKSKTTALGGLQLSSQLSPACSVLYCSLQPRHKANHHTVQPSLMGLSILLENNLPLYIILGIRSFDILPTCSSHLTLCAITNLTVSCNLISSFNSAL
jgi:hypothetical protein